MPTAPPPTSTVPKSTLQAIADLLGYPITDVHEVRARYDVIEVDVLARDDNGAPIAGAAGKVLIRTDRLAVTR